MFNKLRHLFGNRRPFLYLAVLIVALSIVLAPGSNVVQATTSAQNATPSATATPKSTYTPPAGLNVNWNSGGG